MRHINFMHTIAKREETMPEETDNTTKTVYLLVGIEVANIANIFQPFCGCHM
jgi:hypothetical protein